MRYEFSRRQVERRSVPGSALEPAQYSPVFCGRWHQLGQLTHRTNIRHKIFMRIREIPLCFFRLCDIMHIIICAKLQRVKENVVLKICSMEAVDYLFAHH